MLKYIYNSALWILRSDQAPLLRDKYISNSVPIFHFGHDSLSKSFLETFQVVKFCTDCFQNLQQQKGLGPVLNLYFSRAPNDVHICLVPRPGRSTWLKELMNAIVPLNIIRRTPGKPTDQGLISHTKFSPIRHVVQLFRTNL